MCVVYFLCLPRIKERTMFSNDARWDRHTPDQTREEDQIDVGVIFRRGKIIPKSFIWRRRTYQVKEVTYHWTENRGGETLYFFSVTDGVNLYQIYLNNRHMCWRLKRSCPIDG
jgi:hypothetical protein